MDRQDLYEKMALRKDKPRDYEPYDGNNGRVNKCVSLMRQGKIRVGGRLVDVGGGIGDLGYAVRDLFDERIVVDISDTSSRAARAKGNTTLVMDVDRTGLAPLDNGSVDTICALDFIEHIIDPENFARECYQVLKPGGEVFVNTPNIRFWKHIEQLWLYGTFPHTSGDTEVFHGGHLAFFTFSDLCAIFSAAGFGLFEQFMDEECYEEPPHRYISSFNPPSLDAVRRLLMQFGCPNLLFKAVKK